MFENIWTIAKKNLAKSSRLKSKVSRLTLVACLLFLITTFLFMASFIINPYDENSEWDFGSKHRILIINAPESFLQYVEEKERLPFEYVLSQASAYYDFVGMNRLMSENSAFMTVVFPVDFDARIFSEHQTDRPQIVSYFNTDRKEYKAAHDDIIAYIVRDFGAHLTTGKGITVPSRPAFSVALDWERLTDYSDESGGIREYISRMIIPLIVFIAALFVAMESGVDAVAGEKENGTFSALLLTPASKFQIVAGNILGVFLRTIPSGAVIVVLAVIALGRSGILAFPGILLVVGSLVLLLSSLIIVISVLNKTVLSAQTAFLPIFLILLIVCVMAMNESANPEPLYYFIPFFGHYLGIAAILTGVYSFTHFIVLLIVSLLISAILFVVSVRLLHSERFTTTNDASSDFREIRERARLLNPKVNYLAYPKSVIFGYRANRWRSAFRLISYHYTLPLVLLSVFQPLALIVPALFFMRTDESVRFIESIAEAAERFQVRSAVVSVYNLVGLLMREQAFILGMAGGYIVIILIYFFIVKVLEKNPLSSMGLPLRAAGGIRRAVLSYARGLVIGFSMIAGVYLILLFFGQIRIGGFSMTSDALPLFLSYIVMWIPQGASEEIMMRGYMLPRVAVKFGRAGAVGLTSLLFGLLHSGNIGVTPLALANLILIAAFFALLSYRTGEIFTVCAAHSAWNFTQGNIFGLQVSGSEAPAALMSTEYTLDAKALITGGDFGPEGGLAVTLITVLAIVIFFIFTRKAKRAETVAEIARGETV